MAHDELIALTRTFAMRTGDTFTLASGRTSTVYFNMKPLLMRPRGLELACGALASLCKNEAYVGGLAVGCVPLIAGMVVATGTLHGFFVRTQAKDHGTQDTLEGLADGETLVGKTAVMVEDVTTTGASVLRAVAVARAAGAQVERVLTLLDREEGATEALAAEGLTLEHVMTAKQVQNG